MKQQGIAENGSIQDNLTISIPNNMEVLLEQSIRARVGTTIHFVHKVFICKYLNPKP